MFGCPVGHPTCGKSPQSGQRLSSVLGLWYNSGDKSDSPPKRDGRGRAGWAAQTERDNGGAEGAHRKGERKMEQTESRLGRWTKQGMRFLKWLLYSAGI